MDNVKLELEKRKVVCGAKVIKGVGYLFRVVTEAGWRGIGDTVDGTQVLKGRTIEYIVD